MAIETPRMDEPLRHIPRATLPWRDGPTHTECGRLLRDVKATATFHDVRKLIKQLGQQRAAFLVCLTCAQHAKGVDWSGAPVAVLAQEVEQVRRDRFSEVGVRGASYDLFLRELRALATLVEAHATEFQSMVDGLDDTVDLAAHRAAKSTQARRRTQ